MRFRPFIFSFATLFICLTVARGVLGAPTEEELKKIYETAQVGNVGDLPQRYLIIGHHRFSNGDFAIRIVTKDPHEKTPPESLSRL